ncbi:MAG: hypothetical protein M3R39_07735 [Actinomycetota bacterium]|nr:hypothetical protein [Actinomycetota bacterium]
MIAGLAAWVVLVPGAARAVPGPTYQAPDGSYCYDLNVDCGYGDIETGVYTESFDAYAYSPGTCRTRYARATRHNLAWRIVFRYNEQVRWCWRGGVITYFWRDRWPSDTSFGWSFDGHIGSNCAYEHCVGRGVGTYSTDAWTQGAFHACVGWYCPHKYPIVDIWVHGDGGSGASVSGA